MNRDDDVNVPDLGPAEPERGGYSAPEPQRYETPEGAVNSGNGLVQPLVIIILIVAVSALGYFGFDVYKAQQQDETTFLKAQEQMAQLQKLIEQAEKGAEQSGEQLKGNVTSLETALKEKDKQLDSEIAKLWAVAYQKNKPQIEQQAKELEELKKSLAALKKESDSQKASLKSLNSTLAKQEKQLQTAVAAKDEAEKLQQSVKAEVNKLSKLIARVETETRANNELMQEQQAELLKSQRTLTDRVAKLEGKSTGDLERRVKLNEQAVRAFDSTRSQLSQDLLYVKQKLNNLQLMIEKK